MNTQPSHPPEDDARRVAVRRLLAGGAAAAAVGGAAAFIAHDDELAFPGEDERQARHDRGDRGDRGQRHESQPEAETHAVAAAQPSVGAEHAYSSSGPAAPPRDGDSSGRGEHATSDPIGPEPDANVEPIPDTAPATTTTAAGPATEAPAPVAQAPDETPITASGPTPGVDDGTDPGTGRDRKAADVRGRRAQRRGHCHRRSQHGHCDAGRRHTTRPRSGRRREHHSLVDANGRVVGSIDAGSGRVVVGEAEVGTLRGTERGIEDGGDGAPGAGEQPQAPDGEGDGEDVIPAGQPGGPRSRVTRAWCRPVSPAAPLWRVTRAWCRPVSPAAPRSRVTRAWCRPVSPAAPPWRVTRAWCRPVSQAARRSWVTRAWCRPVSPAAPPWATNAASSR